MTPPWYVITGGPSSGKTTLLQALSAQGYAVVPEAARLVIDEGIASGQTLAQIRQDERAFQDIVLARKLEIERLLDRSTVTFFDRGIHDSLAYYAYYKWPISAKMQRQAAQAHYAKVFLCEQLPIYESDYSRTESVDFALELQRLLKKYYQKAGCEVVLVPVLSPNQRLQFILDTINGRKKELS